MTVDEFTEDELLLTGIEAASMHAERERAGHPNINPAFFTDPDCGALITMLSVEAAQRGLDDESDEYRNGATDMFIRTLNKFFLMAYLSGADDLANGNFPEEFIL